MVTAKGSGIVLIRGGEGIQEPTDNLPDTILAMLEIDSEVPLRNRGLVPDCRRVFSLDFYLPEDLRYYIQAEAYVLADKKYGPMYQKLKALIFKASPKEAKNWDEIQIQRIDAHGAGALWIQGMLKTFCAVIGRPYEPAKRDALEHLPKREPAKKGAHKGEIWVSMIADLVFALSELNPDEVGLPFGVFGGTGRAIAAVIGEILADLGYNLVRNGLVSMPDSFMVNEHTPAEVADSLVAVIDVLSPMALYAGLGQDGVFWHFLGRHMRTIGERFSNVVAKKMAFGAAPIITIVGVPFRSDLEERWLVGQSALHTIDEADALDRLLQARAAKNPLVTCEVISFERGQGIHLKVNNPRTLKLWQWELLLPALAYARSHIGTMLLPVSTKVKKGGIGIFGREEVVEKHLPVAKVPLMDELLNKAGVSSVDRLAEATAFWALTKVERLMLERCKEMTFEAAFASIKAGFVQNSREILGNLIFSSPLFPPASAVFDKPAQAFFMWGQVNLSAKALADALCGYFAKVDRTSEEQEAMRVDEEARKNALMEKVAEQMAKLEG